MRPKLASILASCLMAWILSQGELPQPAKSLFVAGLVAGNSHKCGRQFLVILTSRNLSRPRPISPTHLPAVLLRCSFLWCHSLTQTSTAKFLTAFSRDCLPMLVSLAACANLPSYITAAILNHIWQTVSAPHDSSCHVWKWRRNPARLPKAKSGSGAWLSQSCATAYTGGQSRRTAYGAWHAAQPTSGSAHTARRRGSRARWRTQSRWC